MNFEHLYRSPIIELPLTEKCDQYVQASPISYQQSSNRLYDRSLLPTDFVPSPYSVIFGRGKKCTEAFGNRRLRVIASLYLSRYSKASNKDEKSEIVSEILATILSANQNKSGAFIKQKGCQWYKVDDGVAREKISQVLRDLLHTKYRSSMKNKINERRKKRVANRNCISSTTVTITESLYQINIKSVPEEDTIDPCYRKTMIPPPDDFETQILQLLN